MHAWRLALPAAVARLSRRSKGMILLAVDAAVAPLALCLAHALVAEGWPTAGQMLRAAGLAGLCSAVFGLHRIKLNALEGPALHRSGAAAALAALAWAGAGGTVVTAVQFGLVLFLTGQAVRAAMRGLLIRVLRLAQPCTRVLIYGAGSTGLQLAAALDGHPRLRVMGFVDDSAGVQGLLVSGLRVYGADRIGALARQMQVDRVLMAMPSVAPARLALIERRLQDLGLCVQRVPSLARLAGVGVAGTPLPARVPAGTLPGGEGYAGRAVMVTGAGGSVGSELCRQILAMRPRRLVLFDLCEFALYTIERELREADTGVEIVPILGSVTDARLLRGVLLAQEVEVVIHAAAYKHVPLVEANPIAGIANNVLGTRTLAEAAVECGVARFVLISSDKAVRATSVMGATKRTAEIAVQDIARRARGTAFAMVRFGNVMGSSGSVIPLFREQIARGGPVTLTHPEVTRYFMTIAEAARLVLLAGSFGAPGRRDCDVFVLDMGAPVRIRDLAVQMIEAAGYRLRSPADPAGDIEIAVTGLRPGEKLHEELLIEDGLLPTPHPRILRAAEPGLPEWQVARMLHELRSALDLGNAALARAVLFEHVEGPRTEAEVVAAE